MLKLEVEIFDRTKSEFIEKYGEKELLRLSRLKGTKRTLQALLEGLIRAQQSKIAKDIGSDAKRLTLAHKAISGVPPSAFANQSDDRRYLMQMAEIKSAELQAHSQGKGQRISSNVALAKLALKNDEGTLDLDVALKAEKRLSEKFRDFWKQWDELEQDKLDQFEALQTTALMLIELMLKELGIAFYAYD
jgi:uncharacterized protein with von Willebrand factor type A (vWA) domain